MHKTRIWVKLNHKEGERERRVREVIYNPSHT